MAFKFEKDKPYIMPVYFGPSTIWHDEEGNPKLYPPATVESLSVYFETNPEQIDALLPEGFTSNAPVINVNACEFGNVGWLGGFTYNLVNINTPVHFKGEKDEVDGDLILAMFENDADAILAGRELAGYNKPAAEIPRFNHFGTITTCTASSRTNFQFMKLQLDESQEAENLGQIHEIESMTQGKLNYLHIPEVGNLTKPAVSGVVFMPKKWDAPTDYPYELMTPKTKYCNGTVEFNMPKTWQDMPVWYNVAKGLASLEIRRFLGGCHSFFNEPCDYDRSLQLR